MHRIMTILLIILTLLLTSVIYTIPAQTTDEPTAENLLDPAFKVRATLRSLGSSQLAYMYVNGENVYASFEELQDDQYIAESYSTENICDNYALHFFVGGEGTDAWFVILTLPTAQSDLLPIYVITEDQVVRKINMDNLREFIYEEDPVL